MLSCVDFAIVCAALRLTAVTTPVMFIPPRVRVTCILVAHLTALEPILAAVPGTVSVWCGRPGGVPRYAREAGATHYAASTMKAAILAALYRAGETGELDLDAEVPVHNEFASAAAGAGAFGCTQSYDNDDAVWRRLGRLAPLRWLAERMIVRSSNLATNLVLARVGLPAVARVWEVVGARHSVVHRGIEDSAAAEAGISNLVTAADLAALLGAIAAGADSTGALASPDSCQAMLEILFAQECTEDLAAGLPPGTRIAHKNGWINGVRHGAGVIYPEDAPPFVLAVCTTTPLAVNEQDDEACQLVARVAAAAWADRADL
jgi:beta-lactamase class A